MWSPTHINVTVHRARNLLCKGKSGTNDCYATMQFGKDKYHTSIKEKVKDPEWQEECDFVLSEQLSLLKIGVYHRNLLGLDEFLGHVSIPLDQFQLYERPRSRWYALKAKPGSTKPEKNRGEVELTVAFMVHSMSGSSVGLNKSEKTSKTMSIKSLAHTVGDKLAMKWPSKSSLSAKSGSRSDVSSGAFSAQSTSQKSLTDSNSPTEATKTLGSCKDQMSSLASLVELSEDTLDSVFPLNDSVTSSTVPSPDSMMLGEKSITDGKPRASISSDAKDDSRMRRVASELPPTPSKEKLNEKFRRFRDGSAVKCYTLGHPGRSLPQVSAYEMHEMEEYKRSRRELQKTKNVISSETLDHFSGCEKEELIKLIVDQRSEISKKDSYIRDLEDYIDNLLVKVIETQPKLLQNPYEPPIVHSSKRLSSASASPPTIPLSSTMPPGIYVNAAWGENALSKGPTPVAKRSNASKNNNKKTLTIASPFKKLQALIK